MSELIWQGLTITVLGMGLTFAALGLLILVMILLERLFRPPQPPVPDEAELKETPTVSTLARSTEDEEIVAAIAVALAYLRTLDIGQSELGSTLEAGPGPWGMRGRVQQHAVYTSKTTWRN